jgi:uncharacterized membrane protein YfcA
MPDPGLVDFAIVAIAAFAASVVGGIAGYGVGLLMPPVLVPVIGAEAVVPVLGVSGLMINGSRWLAFRHAVSRRTALTVLVVALPSCVIGAYLYTLLSGPAAAIAIGAMLILSVPIRRVLRRHKKLLSASGLAIGATGFGLLTGGTSGAGIVLNALLLTAGLQGAAVVATDACVSSILAVFKTAVFQGAGALTPLLWLLALAIGAASVPGAFLAAAITRRTALRHHTLVLDAVVLLGGALLVARGITGPP